MYILWSSSLRSSCSGYGRVTGQVRQFSRSDALAKSHYDTLGVKFDAKPADLKAQFYSLSKKWHPDKHGGSKEATHRFQEISAAYGTLSDDVKRKEYDARNGFRAGSSYSHSRGSAYGGPSHNFTAEEHWRWHQARYGQPGTRKQGSPFGPGYRPPNMRQPPGRGRIPFNFDEWYQAHYGPDAMRRARAQQQSKQQRENLEAERRSQILAFFFSLFFLFFVAASLRLEKSDSRRY